MKLRRKAIRVARSYPDLRSPILLAIREADRVSGSRTAKPWGKLPKGWTDKSVKKFWGTMTGDVKHKVTKCMKKMDGKVDDTGAFCASLADKVTGTTMWRGKHKKTSDSPVLKVKTRQKRLLGFASVKATKRSATKNKYPAVEAEIKADFRRHAIGHTEMDEMLADVRKAPSERAAWKIVDDSHRYRTASDKKAELKEKLEVARAVNTAGEQGVRVDWMPTTGVRELLQMKVIEAERGYLYPRQPAFDRWVKSLRGIRLARIAGTKLRKWFEPPRGFKPTEEWYEKAEDRIMNDNSLEVYGLKNKILMAAWDNGWAYGYMGKPFYKKQLRWLLLLADRYGLKRKAMKNYQDGLKDGLTSKS